jgi:hypothetical protein
MDRRGSTPAFGPRQEMVPIDARPFDHEPAADRAWPEVGAQVTR